MWGAVRESFGKTTVQTGAATTYLMRFPGQWEDGLGGFNQNLWREYSPRYGRYDTSDPITLDGGLNIYNYSNQNPLNTFDPNGENPVAILQWTVRMTIALCTRFPAACRQAMRCVTHPKSCAKATCRVFNAVSHLILDDKINRCRQGQPCEQVKDAISNVTTGCLFAAATDWCWKLIGESKNHEKKLADCQRQLVNCTKALGKCIPCTN